MRLSAYEKRYNLKAGGSAYARVFTYQQALAHSALDVILFILRLLTFLAVVFFILLPTLAFFDGGSEAVGEPVLELAVAPWSPT